MSMLEELYYGNIAPWERGVGQNEEYRKISKQIINMEENLLENLSNDKKKIYEQLAVKKCEQQSITDKESFACGFRIGAQIMLEILNCDEKS